MSIQCPTECEICAIVGYLAVKGKAPVEIFNEVKTVYGDNIMNHTSVYKCCHMLKNDNTSVHNGQRSGKLQL